jgi:hypothetical protein
VRKGDDISTFIVPKVENIRSLNLPDPQGPAQACSGKTLPFTSQRGFLTYNTYRLRAGRSEDRIPVGGESFRTRQNGPWDPPWLLYSAHWVSFSGVKRPVCGVKHPPPSSAEVKERIDLYLYSLSEPSWSLPERNLLFLHYLFTIPFKSVHHKLAYSLEGPRLSCSFGT